MLPAIKLSRQEMPGSKSTCKYLRTRRDALQLLGIESLTLKRLNILVQITDRQSENPIHPV